MPPLTLSFISGDKLPDGSVILNGVIPVYFKAQGCIFAPPGQRAQLGNMTYMRPLGFQASSHAGRKSANTRPAGEGFFKGGIKRRLVSHTERKVDFRPIITLLYDVVLTVKMVRWSIPGPAKEGLAFIL